MGNRYRTTETNTHYELKGMRLLCFSKTNDLNNIFHIKFAQIQEQMLKISKTNLTPSKGIIIVANG